MSDTDPPFRYVPAPPASHASIETSYASQLTSQYGWRDAGFKRLYSKGKRLQWDADDRIDWSLELDPANPLGLPDQIIGIYGSDLWNRLPEAERAIVRQHHQACQMSQFLHGEQAAMMCAAKIVQQASDLDTKMYAATQAMDEARHVEIFSGLLGKIGIGYAVTPGLSSLLTQVIQESRWDMTFLGMQVLVEGLGVAAFQRYRDDATNPLVGSIFAYVIQDEARHVAFGREALRGHYLELTEAERNEREEFVIEALRMMADRLLLAEVWPNVGLPQAECVRIQTQSPSMVYFRKRMFSRIVPIVKEAGLWGPLMRDGLEKLGVLELADLDPGAMLADDARVAERFDALRAPPG